MLKEVERSIDGLDEHLRKALLLTTRYTHSKSADILGISKGALRARVRAAKRRVAEDLLGDEWHDAETISAVAMYIDAAAIHMQKRQESVWRRAMSWVFPDDVRVPIWRFAGSLGVLLLAGYLGAQLPDLGEEPDTRDGVIESEAGELVDVLAFGPDAVGGAEHGAAGGIVERGRGAGNLAGVAASSIGTEASAEWISEMNLRSASSASAPRVRAGDFSLRRDLGVLRQRMQDVQRRGAALSDVYRHAADTVRAIEGTCAENRWEFGQGAGAAETEVDMAYVNRRRRELEQERRGLERQRRELENVRGELEQNRKGIELEFHIKGAGASTSRNFAST